MECYVKFSGRPIKITELGVIMRKQTNYVSEIDELLAELRATLPESDSQKAEVKKYKEIDEKRDKVKEKTNTDIWEEF